VSGLTPQGFVAKTVDEILAELRQSQRSNVDGSLNTSATGVIANLNMAFALELAAAWEAIAEVYDAHDPVSAEGIAADANGSLVGIPRRPATKALTTLHLTMAPNTLVPEGSVVSDPTRPAVRFVTLADALTSTTSTSFDVAAAAETAGTLTAGANTLTKIESPASGWTAVTNPATAIPGQDVETDEEYRIRQAELRATSEGSTLAGIVADVRLLPNVITAAGYENTTDVTVNSLPPHSFEIVVSGGADAAIAQSIWRNKPAGIETYGTTTVTITDSEGVTHPVRFSRPVDKIVNVNYAATTDASYVAGSIRSTLEQASVDITSLAHFAIGAPVYLVRLLAIASEVRGVVNVTLDIALAPALPPDAIPTSPDNVLIISSREVATFTGANWVGP
jgi:uncharacterized phage protein gp47/JayE